MDNISRKLNLADKKSPGIRLNRILNCDRKVSLEMYRQLLSKQIQAFDGKFWEN